MKKGVVKGRFRKVKTVLLIVIASLVLIAGLGLLYINFVHTEKCETFECFQKNMDVCSRAEYVNEEPDASWRYTITGFGLTSCNVNVELLQAKKGELGIEELSGLSMDCEYQKGFSGYPEGDLGKCHGILKEALQEKIIEKLHKYVLENLGKIDESLNSGI